MTDHLSQGELHQRKAEQKLRRWTLFGLSIVGPNYEDATELLEKAGNCFKLDRNWEKAGGTYKMLADCHLKIENFYDAALAYVNASSCYKKISIGECISCLRLAVYYFKETGRINMAARHCKEIGELCKEDQNLKEAICFYEEAADLFRIEESTTSENQCKQEVANISAQLEDYDKAIVLFVEIAKCYLNNNLLKYSVKGTLLNAGLCYLCKGDMVAMENALDNYQDIDTTFCGTREFKFLADLASAFKAEDLDKFTDVLKEFDHMTPLDAWKTKLLLRVKEALKAKENGEDDLT